jgi:hypothetical protein
MQARGGKHSVRALIVAHIVRKANAEVVRHYRPCGVAGVAATDASDPITDLKFFRPFPYGCHNTGI